MLWAFKQLGVPLRYLAIKQGDGIFHSKTMYDFVLPGLFSIANTTLVYLLSIKMGIFADKGLIPAIIDLLNLIIAFFIAALAAVATFERKGLDDKIKGQPATLSIMTKSGSKKDFVLTHRQFICYLFGYLSFVSLLFLILLHFVRLIGPDLAKIIPYVLFEFSVIKIIITQIFFFVLWQIVITMLLGVYFLCDRLQFLNEPDI
ncbi:hypothetical protein [Oleomonas cavernae]|uniref:hypothetical protein n=1 Tax=Oleomonas cavernae TaxID=2320859 RepID=UPI0011C3C374|nr:hypothetical protein [Oleomonas cavernae]